MGIEISIVAGLDAATSSVKGSGSVQHVITDTEVGTFGVRDAALKNAVGKLFGKNPNDAYLHSDTPWGDLYKTYGWPQVQTVLVVQSATLTGITSQPVIVATKTFSNQSSVKATYNAGITDQVANTTSSNWSTTDSITVGQKISYKATFPGGEVGGETSLSYTHGWGQGGSESTAITVGSQTGVSVTLDPGESVEAQLTASRGVMKVRIVYVAYLTGNTAINYNPTYKDHHFWALDIGSVMSAGGIANSKQFTEDIEVGYYSNAKIVLKDSKGNLQTAFMAVAKAAQA